MKRKLLVTAISTVTALSLTCSTVFAAATKTEAKANVETNKGADLVAKMSQGQLSTLRKFKAAKGLTGYVMQPAQGGSPVIIYANDAGEYALYGTLIGPNGDNLSEANEQKYVKSFIAKDIESHLGEVSYFSQGRDDAPHKIFALADPNCSACHYFYDNAKKSVDEGKLQIHWILVAFVRPDSHDKALGIMAAKDSAKAMEQNEAGFDAATEEGGAIPLENAPKDLVAKLDSNMKFMKDTGLSSTPTLMFYNSKGEFDFVKGSPRDMEQFIKQYEPTDTKPKG